MDVRILEYSGLDTSNPLDVTASAAGSSVSSEQRGGDHDVGQRIDLRSGDDGDGFLCARGRDSPRGSSPADGDIAEDKVVSSTGSYSATGQTSSAPWVMQMATFRAAGQGAEAIRRRR